MPERRPPDDPKEWLNRARSDLLLARSLEPGIYLEDLSFHAQQAAEKAIKALLIQRKIEFPYVHDISELLTRLENTGLRLPESVRRSEILSRFAVFTRYPGVAPPVSQDEYEEAMALADEVVRWAQEQLEGRGGN